MKALSWVVELFREPVAPDATFLVPPLVAGEGTEERRVYSHDCGHTSDAYARFASGRTACLECHRVR
jgi:hypothetical protein